MGEVPIRPLEGYGLGVVAADVAHELAPEVRRGRKDAAGDDITLDLREPELDLVEPRRIGRRVVHVDPRMLIEEGRDALSLVG